MKIPLAERFHSIQGEGFWTGTSMHFIRLPGCTVGVPTADAPMLTGPEKKAAWRCTAFSGEAFWCDTDFHRYLEEESEAIFKDTHERHICLTGGEPLMHRKVVDFFRTQCQIQNIQLHIETSGTIDMWWEADLHPLTAHGSNDKRDPWLTVSPKKGWTPYMIRFAAEVKLLVHPSFDEASLDSMFRNHTRVYLSPINNIGSGGLYHPDSGAALDRCFELLRLHPDWKLSVQLHKYLSVR
jgi:organic radical activating enzyme